MGDELMALTAARLAEKVRKLEDKLSKAQQDTKRLDFAINDGWTDGAGRDDIDHAMEPERHNRGEEA